MHDEAFADVSSAVAEMGLTGIAAPEQVGGGAGSLLDLAVALEAAAGALVPGPLLGSAVASVVLGEHAGDVVAGEMRVGFCLDQTVAHTGDHVTADLEIVHDAVGATHLLLLSEKDVLLAPLADATISPRPSPDLGRRVAAVTLDAVEATPVAGIDEQMLRDVVLTLAAAEASGVARWCLDAAVEYAGVREQFGRKIGSFQAVKHLCAEMLETSESVTAAAWDAARAHAESREQCHSAATWRASSPLEGAVARQVLHPGARRHRLHLRARRPPLPASRAGVAGQLCSLHVVRRHAGDLAADGQRRSAGVELGAEPDQETTTCAPRSARSWAGSCADPAPPAHRAGRGGLLAPHWPAP